MKRRLTFHLPRPPIYYSEGVKMCENLLNDQAAECSISHKFGTESDHVTLDLQQTFKVKGSKVKVTA